MSGKCPWNGRDCNCQTFPFKMDGFVPDRCFARWQLPFDVSGKKLKELIEAMPLWWRQKKQAIG